MRHNQRTSPVWAPSKEEMEIIVSECETIGQILARFGMRNHGSNCKTLVRRFAADNIDYKSLKKPYKPQRARLLVPLEEVLVEHSAYSRSSLKKRLIQTGMLKNQCAKCGLGTQWDGERLVMVLDHINGVCDDNRIHNLRLLCPNCNSQTSTFAGRRNKVHKKCVIEKVVGDTLKKVARRLGVGNTCPNCLKWKFVKSTLCNDCQNHSPKLSRRKADRPTAEELQKLLWEIPTTKIAETYGVSDVAVAKWANSYKIDKPPRGYWAKKNAITELGLLIAPEASEASIPERDAYV